MQVNRSGYYQFWKNQIGKKDSEDVRLLAELRSLHRESDGSYGSRRLSQGMKLKGYKVGRHRTRTLMRKANIACKQRRRFRVTTNSQHHLPVAENALNRQFNVETANKIWVADITYLWTHEGWLYIAAVLDLFSRRIVGWSMANNMKEELVHNALKMAIGRRDLKKGLMHHSDRGSQYASYDYKELLRQHNITAVV